MDSTAIIFLGSEKDKGVAEKITAFWKKNGFAIKFEVRAVSAHKAAESVLLAVKEYEKKFKNLVFIAVAGRSNALGPLISGHSKFPVINCPVLCEKFDFMDLLSSVRMPGNVPCATILEPENAALHAAKILALCDAELAAKASQYMAAVGKEIMEKDIAIKKEFLKK
ncbi:MAG: 5-(carboxyamino)imidazole ribonucleotide mutase [Candidatus Diapherotrites archaeon]|nr:5-(carboxyamino)imidazole ribonucleotide mutase [Candidatus Diapherotrites archaeon]